MIFIDQLQWIFTVSDDEYTTYNNAVEHFFKQRLTKETVSIIEQTIQAASKAELLFNDDESDEEMEDLTAADDVPPQKIKEEQE